MRGDSGDRDDGIKHSDNGDVIDSDDKGGVVNTVVRNDTSDDINQFCLQFMFSMFGCNTISISNKYNNLSFNKSIREVTIRHFYFLSLCFLTKCMHS